MSSDSTSSRRLQLVARRHDVDDHQRAKSAFFQFDQRLTLIDTVIKPGYARCASLEREQALQFGAH